MAHRTVHGEVSPGYDAVAEAVAESLEGGSRSGGVAVAAFVHGELVVDVWGGAAGERTLFHTWSAVKPLVGTCLLLLVERDRVRLDAPVRDIWPELSAAADGRMRVRHVLAHAAGLASVPPPGTAASLLDWTASVAALERVDPDWTAGEAVGEHALTYGHLVGELVRRLDGRSIGRFLEAELCTPLGIDVHVGLARAEQAPVADTYGLTDAWWAERRGPPDSLASRAFGFGLDDALVNSEEWRSGEVPAVNGHGTARGLALFYAAMLQGQLPSGCREVGAQGLDAVLGEHVAWTLAGGRIIGEDVGMGGVGGQWAAARPSLGLAWAFLTNEIGSIDRAQRVEDALVRTVSATQER
jgi:CubicO group peptidase (beta-lactamase class C family)